MKGRWAQVFRVLQLTLQASTSVTEDGSLSRHRYSILSITLWAAVYSLGLHLFFFKPLTDDMFGCFSELLYDTFSVYSVKFVLLSHWLLGFLAGFFCLVRMHCRDLAAIVSRGVSLYDTATKGLGRAPQLSGLVLFLLLSVYAFPIVLSFILAVYCKSYHAAGSPPLLELSGVFLFSFIWTVPGSVMTSVFFLILDTSNESLAQICRRLDALVMSKTPKPFLKEVFCIESHSDALYEEQVSTESLHSLRHFHHELISYMSDVLTTFQIDIFIHFIAAFYQNVIYNYATVYNSVNLFRSIRVLVFILYNLHGSFILMVSLWMVCAGPSRIQAQTDQLLNSVSRLAATSSNPTDLQHEIRLFELQSRNHTVHFYVFGMFKLNISLLFTMVVSVLSYIVILIQFATPPADVSAANSHFSLNLKS